MHIKAKVFPGFKTEKIIKINPNQFKVYLREQAQNNAANKRLIVALEEYLRREPGKIRLISGHKQSSKILEVKDE